MNDAAKIAALTTGVYQGDAIDLIKLLPDESVDLVCSDPPYNTSRANNMHTMGRTGFNFGWDGNFDQLEWLKEIAPKVRKGGGLVIWNDWKNLGLMDAALAQLGCEGKRVLIWKKRNPIPRNMKRVPVQAHEFALWAVKKGGIKRNKWTFNRTAGAGYDTGEFTYALPRAPSGRERHPSAKPDDLFRDVIRMFSNPRDLVVDPFAGGGTTAFAATVEDRRHISFELSMNWHAEAVEHWLEAPQTPAVDQLADLAEETP